MVSYLNSLKSTELNTVQNLPPTAVEFNILRNSAFNYTIANLTT